MTSVTAYVTQISKFESDDPVRIRAHNTTPNPMYGYTTDLGVERYVAMHTIKISEPVLSPKLANFK